MSVELEELFHEVETPEMRVSASAVVDAGQRKVRRRRALWGTGSGVLAAAAAVAIAVGTAIPNSSSTSPMPAHPSGTHSAPTAVKSTALTPVQQFFQTDGGTADRVRDPFPAQGGAQATYQAVRVGGDLRIRRIVNGASALLTANVHYADGGTASSDGQHTIVVRPVPTTTWSASLTGGTPAIGGTSSNGVTLADKTTAAVFVVEHRFSKASEAQMYWLTADGSGGSSLGDTPAMGTVDGTPIGTVTVFSFPKARVCGWTSTNNGGGSVNIDDIPDHVCFTSGANAPSDRAGSAWWIRIVPGPVTDVKILPGSGVVDPRIVQTPLSGSNLVALSVWVTIPNLAESKLPVLNSASWTGPDGRRVTWHDGDN